MSSGSAPREVPARCGEACDPQNARPWAMFFLPGRALNKPGVVLLPGSLLSGLHTTHPLPAGTVNPQVGGEKPLRSHLPLCLDIWG